MSRAGIEPAIIVVKRSKTVRTLKPPSPRGRNLLKAFMSTSKIVNLGYP